MVPEVLQVLQPWNQEAVEVVETVIELRSRLEYLQEKPSYGGYEMHEYWKKLLKMDFAKSEADLNFSSVAASIIHFEK